MLKLAFSKGDAIKTTVRYTISKLLDWQIQKIINTLI